MPYRALRTLITPKYVTGTIIQTFSSKRGRKTAWCIVEGIDDIGIYDKFFDANTTTTSPARAEIFGKGGYENVVKVINDVKKALPECLKFDIFRLPESTF